MAAGHADQSGLDVGHRAGGRLENTPGVRVAQPVTGGGGYADPLVAGGQEQPYQDAAESEQPCQ